MDKYKPQLKLIEYDLQLSMKPGTQIETKLARLTNSLAGILRLLEQLTTVEPTQTVPTTVEPSVVEEPTYLVTRQLPPSAPVDTGSGLVERSSECVHQVHEYQRSILYLGKIANCQKCGVTMSIAWIPAQGVEATSLTSVKQPSKESVENSVEESAKSQLKFMSDGWCPWHQMDYSPSERAVHMLRYPSHDHSLWLKETK